MKKFLIYFLLIITGKVTAQQGYVKLDNDSIMKGFVRSFKDVNTQAWGFEIWKTKKDKSPTKVFKNEVVEYSLGKDTVIILHNYISFKNKNLRIDGTEATYVSQGKINLLIIGSATYSKGLIVPILLAPVAGVILVPSKKKAGVSYVYILEHPKSGIFKGLSPDSKELHEELLEFFSEGFLSKYEKHLGAITYKSLPKFIKFCNSKK